MLLSLLQVSVKMLQTYVKMLSQVSLWFGCDVDPEKNVFGVTGDISTEEGKSVSWLFQQMKN